MPPSSITCTTCCVSKGRKAFLRPFKQRIIVEKVCDSCRAAALLNDSTGRKLQRAIERGDVTNIEGKRLRAQLEALRAQREADRRDKLRDHNKKLWAERKKIKERFGVRVPSPREAQQFLTDPDAQLAFERDQAQKQVAYQQYLRTERARRAKIAAALTGRKRGPYLKAKDRI